MSGTLDIELDLGDSEDPQIEAYGQNFTGKTLYFFLARNYGDAPLVSVTPLPFVWDNIEQKSIITLAIPPASWAGVKTGENKYSIRYHETSGETLAANGKTFLRGTAKVLGIVTT